MGESIKVKKLVEIRYWFGKNWKKVLVVGFLIFAVLSLIALTRGIGYKATANVTSVEIRVPKHPCFGYLITGNLTCNFNPFLYPVTHIFGYKSDSMFSGVSNPYESTGESVKEAAEIAVVFQEFPKNIPFYLSISFVVAFVSVKLNERSKLRKEK